MGSDVKTTEDQLENFDWDTSKIGKAITRSNPPEDLYWHYVNKKKESWDHRIQRMLNAIHGAVHNCSMCPLGRSICREHYTIFDPHVFSTMNPSKWMIVGQNPGYNECLEHQPFVGDAGKYFNNAIGQYGLKRDDFYICNAVRCHTIGNEKPTAEHINSCAPFLQMEINLLKPYLVVTLGAVALDILCPGVNLTRGHGNIYNSERFGVRVYPIYHPSPRNMSSEARRDKFQKGIRILCKLIKAHRAKRK